MQMHVLPASAPRVTLGRFVSSALGVVELEQLNRLQAALADRYTIERELGRGGMAVVFLARDRKHDRNVALKVLLPHVAQAIGAERFQREITIAAKLSHPHILALYDSGDADGLLYYVMPYMRGESLRDRIGREGQLTVDAAVRIGIEVASARERPPRHQAGEHPARGRDRRRGRLRDRACTDSRRERVDHADGDRARHADV